MGTGGASFTYVKDVLHENLILVKVLLQKTVPVTVTVVYHWLIITCSLMCSSILAG